MHKQSCSLRKKPASGATMKKLPSLEGKKRVHHSHLPTRASLRHELGLGSFSKQDVVKAEYGPVQ
jgi:hypothetical protein